MVWFDNGKVDSPKTSAHEHFDAKARQPFPVFARKRTKHRRQRAGKSTSGVGRGGIRAEGGAIN